MSQQRLPGRSQPRSPRGPVKKSNAQFLFRQANLLAERGLGNAQSLSCSSKMKLFSQTNEVAELAQIDPIIHTENILADPGYGN